jgi:hypothetical protein
MNNNTSTKHIGPLALFLKQRREGERDKEAEGGGG